VSAAALPYDVGADLYHEIVAAAAAHLETRLHTAVEAEACRDYLDSREYTLDDATEFGLGFADSSVITYMRGQGFTDEQMVHAGLLIAHENRAPYPRFRNRLAFPIHDVKGRVVGFSARAIDDAEPKYLNSPASPWFSKGELLYHHHRAAPAMKKSGRVFVVEGQFDVVRMVLAGVPDVVAPLGTAMTETQAALLAAGAATAFLLYDADAAGQKAMFRAGLLLLAAGMAVRCVQFEIGEDPDSTIAKGGRDELDQQIEASRDILDLKISHLVADQMFRDIARKRESIEQLLPIVGAPTDLSIREMYIARLADVVGLSRAAIEPLVPPPGETKKSKRRRFRATTSEIVEPPRPNRAPAP
jgi:DNA primase